MEKRILIAGFGVSGRGAARLASRLKLRYMIADESNKPEMYEAAAALEHPPEHLIFGWTPKNFLPKCDEVIISPGIRPDSHFYFALENCAPKLTSELSFALRYIDCPVAAITGTNGKTTTTEITTALFQASGLRTVSAGNIGSSLSDNAIESIRGNLDAIIAEISSFQLENMDPFTPAAAAVLNLASDHLDRHGSMHEYARVKYKIFGDLKTNCIVNASLKEYTKEFLAPDVETTTFSAFESADFSLSEGGIYYRGEHIIDADELHLKGRHNLENAMAALGLLRAVRGGDAMTSPDVLSALRNFKSGEHRMELFLERDGIRFINDSKATNPHSVNAALEAVGGDGNVILILGGLDKGMDFKELRVNSGKVKKAFLIGECAHKIYETLSSDFPCEICLNLEDAVRGACGDAEPGNVVMLSPAAASMDMFKNYRERGDMFKKAVLDYFS